MRETGHKPSEETQEPPARKKILRRRAGWGVVPVIAAALGGAAASEPEGGRKESVVATQSLSEGEIMEEDTTPVFWQGREATRGQLSKDLMAELRQRLGDDFVSDCGSVEACYYAYAKGTLNEKLISLIEAISGKSREELAWCREGMRGFYKEGLVMPGAIGHAIEVGRSDLPPMKALERQAFFQELVKRHIAFLHSAWAQMNVEKGQPERRHVLSEKAGQLIEARTREAIFEATIRYQQTQGRDFEEWYTQGVGEGLPSGSARWKGAHAKTMSALEQLEVEDTAFTERWVRALQREFLASQRIIFLEMSSRARGSALGRAESARWQNRADNVLAQMSSP